MNRAPEILGIPVFGNPAVEDSLSGMIEPATGDKEQTRSLESNLSTDPARFLLEECGVSNPEAALRQMPTRHNLIDTRATRHGEGTVWGGRVIRLPFSG